MNKKIFIVVLGVACVGLSQQLIGMDHKKGPGFYDCLDVEEGKVTAKSARMLAYALNNADKPRKTRRKKGRNLSAAYSVQQETSSVESAQRLATAKRMFNDVAGACKPYAMPVLSMCLIQAAGTVMASSGGADLDCVQAMQPVNNCVQSIHDYYFNCWGGSMGVSAGILNSCETSNAQYRSACLDNFAISSDLYQCASDCSGIALNATADVGELHQKSVALVKQIKADAQYLGSQECMEPKDDKYWSVFTRRMVAELSTLPKLRQKFNIAVQLLPIAFYTCDGK